MTGCQREHFASGYCGPHYKRNHKYGDPLAGRPFRDEGERVRLARLYVVQQDGCWLWTSAVDGVGYGVAWWRGKSHRAHRAVYQAYRGVLPADVELDHLCRTKLCVNPNHLEVVTRSENLRRHYATTVSACPHGHAYDEANTYMDHGKRRCRTCMREAQRRRRAARK